MSSDASSRNRPLRVDILIRFGPVTILLLILISVLTSRYVSGVVRSGIQTRIDQSAEQIGDATAAKLALVTDACRSVAQNDVVVNGIIDLEHRSSATRSFLQSLRLPGSTAQSITMTDYRGRFLAGTDPGLGYEQAGWLDVVTGGQEIVSTDGGSLTIAMPVVYGSRSEGTIVAVLPLKEFLANTTWESTQRVVVYQHQDQIISSTNTQLLPVGPQLQQPERWLMSRASKIDGLPGVKILLFESEAVALETARVVGAALLLVAGILCVGLLAVLWFVSRQVSTPIGLLLQQISHVQETGDLSGRVEARGPRELLELGQRFNAMLTELQHTTVSRHRYQTAQHQLELALEGGNIGLWDWQTESEEVYFSPIFKRQLGFPPDAPWNSFDAWESRLHPEDHQAAMQTVSDYLTRRAQTYESTFRLRCANGTYRTIFSKGVAQFDDQDKPLRMIGVHIDVTERVRSQERLRRVIEGATSGMVMIDDRGTIILVNSRLESMFGYSREELLGEPIEMLLPSGSNLQESARFLQATQRHEAGGGRELLGLHKDAHQVPVEVGWNPIELETGMCVLATVVDITERKRAEDTIKLANKHLERSNAELEQFAYVASHDLQEPLRKVSSFCDLLVSEYGDRFDEEGRQYLSFVVDGAHRMRTLIQDLLNYSRVQTQGATPGKTDVHQALELALGNLAAAIEESSAIITYDEMPIVQADSRQLTQLLQNLIGNAIKYRGEAPPQVHISVEAADNEWIFAIADNGIGIEPAFREKVFGVFKRLHARNKYPGTGIGLAICKRIIEGLEGRIWVESNQPHGSRFLFSIPRQPAAVSG